MTKSIYICYCPKLLHKKKYPHAKYKLVVKYLEGKGYFVINPHLSRVPVTYPNNKSRDEVTLRKLNKCDIVYCIPESTEAPMVKFETKVAADLGKTIYNRPMDNYEQAFQLFKNSRNKHRIEMLAEKFNCDQNRLMFYIEKRILKKIGDERPTELPTIESRRKAQRNRKD
jgi:hypothetical protein